MVKFLLVLLLVASTHAKSEVNALNLEVKRLPFMRDPLYPDSKYWDYGLNLNWDVSFGSLFWENDIGAKTRHDRFRDVYWSYTIGFDLTDHLAIIWDHKSQHAMDSYVDDYPVRDMYGIRINFIEGKK